MSPATPAGGIPPLEERPSFGGRLWRLLVGSPKSLGDRSLFHRLALVPFLAWVGLGSDGLSSSAYGPEEAFRTLGEHTYIALALAFMMAATVLVIAAGYKRVIERFPHGGGGYVVATKLLGERAGVLSGCALLVDYVLTISISIAAAGDALFSFLPPQWHGWKLVTEAILIVALSLLNLRGVKESVLVMTPVFLLFVLTHATLIGLGVALKAPALPVTLGEAAKGYSHGIATLGAGGVLLLFLHAYSLGGGTYTGIEAVSNGLAIMREPRAETGKKTMTYMAVSLAFTATGLLLCYLLWKVAPVAGKTMNAVLVEGFVKVVPFGRKFVILTLVSEGALLVVAAQAGFVDGPRVLANMAVDSWVPRRFSALSERLTTENGVLLMGLASLAALLYTVGDVRHLVVMYSINVFITFSMTNLAMCRLFLRERKQREDWRKRIWIHVVGLAMCLTILGVTVVEKFAVGGWITLSITAIAVVLCFAVRRHYRKVSAILEKLYAELGKVASAPAREVSAIDPSQPTAAILVASYGGLGIHTLLGAIKMFPGHFHNFVFLSVGVIDSGGFKGEGSVEELRARTEETLDKYVALANRLGLAATHRLAIATDAVAEAENLCLGVAMEFKRVTFFAGKVIFERENWIHRMLHNDTAFAVQRRLQWASQPIVVIPARVTAKASR